MMNSRRVAVVTSKQYKKVIARFVVVVGGLLLSSITLVGGLGSGPCDSWCKRNGSPWIASPEVSQKCNWQSSCSGCPECQDGVCRSFCANDDVPWFSDDIYNSKCGWETCSVCPACKSAMSQQQDSKGILAVTMVMPTISPTSHSIPYPTDTTNAIKTPTRKSDSSLSIPLLHAFPSLMAQPAYLSTPTPTNNPVDRTNNPIVTVPSRCHSGRIRTSQEQQTISPTTSGSPIQYRCSSSDTTPTVISSGVTIHIYRAPRGSLCTLALRSRNTPHRDDATSVTPVARSYNGHPWESSAGPYSQLKFECDDSHSHQFTGVPNRDYCRVQLPPDDVGGTATFQLIYFEPSAPKQKRGDATRRVARFLERATMGVTRSALRAVSKDAPLEVGFARWVSNQMALPTTSHREYYRQRVFSSAKMTTSVGRVSHPCHAMSRWTRYALTKLDIGGVLTIEREVVVPEGRGDGGLAILLVDGMARTTINQFDVMEQRGNSKEDHDALSYRICNVEEMVGGMVTLQVKNGEDYNAPCRPLITGNPVVHFSSLAKAQSLQLYILSSNGTKSDFIKSNGDTYIRQTRALCNSVNPNEVYPALTYFSDGDWLLFDPQLRIRSNSLQVPLRDGGLRLARLGALCANVERQFVNEEGDGCVLSENNVMACVNENESASNVVICGSPGEVDNIASMAFDGFRFEGKASTSDIDAKSTAWMSAALTAPDQLRQRTAWALSQIFTLDTHSSFATEAALHHYDIFVRHAFGNYFDILKRVSYSPLTGKLLSYINATASMSEDFGGVTLPPDEKMAREVIGRFTMGHVMLNDDGTLRLDEGRVIAHYDDESIRTLARAWTGFTPPRRRGNILARTYQNDIDPMVINPWGRDVFPKGNLNGGYIGDHDYPLCVDLPDQMFLKAGARFRLLGSRFVPEGQEEEWDRPRGQSSPWSTRQKHSRYTEREEDMYLSSLSSFDENDELPDEPKYIVLPAGESHLHKLLCSPALLDEKSSIPSHYECQFPMYVTLTTNIPCFGIECQIDTVRVVKVDDLYYEFIRPPCVELAFYHGKTIVTSHSSSIQCGNPGLAQATEACCLPDDIPTNDASRHCMYTSERVTYATAMERCVEEERLPCRYTHGHTPPWSDRLTNKCHMVGYAEYHWTDGNCGIMARINSDGRVAIVHHKGNDTTEGFAGGGWFGSEELGELSHHFFRVNWDTGFFPTPDDNCGNGACEFQTHTTTTSKVTTTCLCHTTLFEEPVFLSTCSISHDNISEIIQQLHIGSVDLSVHNNGDDYDDPILIGNHMKVFIRSDTGAYDTDTLFQIFHMGQWRTYRNLRSRVHIQHVEDGSTTNYSFRNPPHFMNFLDRYKRDAEYETDAVLQSLFRHGSTAPFVATSLIRSFGISRPSPRYVQVVSQAFREGVYQSEVHGEGDIKTGFFGTGKYGDLSATVAAILLDREGMALELDGEATHGSLREPLLKLTSFLRAMEFRPDVGDSGRGGSSKASNGVSSIGKGVARIIGQMAHHHEAEIGLFSTFVDGRDKSDADIVDGGPLSPLEQVSRMGLVSPEVPTGAISRHIIGLLNGLFSIIKWGLTDCHEGIGTSRSYANESQLCDYPEGSYDRSSGVLSYSLNTKSNAKDVVDELAMLLTAGRLSDNACQIIQNAYRHAHDPVAGLRLAQQLIIVTPEFHSSNAVTEMNQRTAVKTSSNKNKNDLKKIMNDIQSPSLITTVSDSYKAIIYLFQSGGCDSYNMIIPFSGCEVDGVPTNLYQEYISVRGRVAVLTSEGDGGLMMIDTVNTKTPISQVCETFGVHPRLEFLASLYNEEDLLFMANVGVLTESHIGDGSSGVTKEHNRHVESKSALPLFLTHDIQTRLVHRLDPENSAPGTGVLGRLVDVLQRTGYKTNSFSTVSNTRAEDVLQGNGETSESASYLGRNNHDGILRFNPQPSVGNMTQIMNLLNGDTNEMSSVSAGTFGTIWSKHFKSAIMENEKVNQMLSQRTTLVDFPDSELGRQLELVSRTIKTHSVRNTERDVFYVELPGFDSHSEPEPSSTLLDKKFTEMNNALKAFVSEMKLQKEWNNIAVLSSSEFGRTLRPNNNDGRGTNHGWAGHYFLLGGNVNGGQIVGEYPHDLAGKEDGMGRMVPTTSWEQVLNGVVEWLGVSSEEDLRKVFPIRDKFNSLFTKDVLF